jgi:hypothetical protein
VDDPGRTGAELAERAGPELHRQPLRGDHGAGVAGARVRDAGALGGVGGPEGEVVVDEAVGALDAGSARARRPSRARLRPRRAAPATLDKVCARAARPAPGRRRASCARGSPAGRRTARAWRQRPAPAPRSRPARARAPDGRERSVRV